MKLKQLEACLSQVKPFDTPDYMLEQYPTSAHLAARILFAADGFGDVEDKVVFDIGTGTGMFAIAAQVMGAGLSTGFDIDQSALDIAHQNAEEIGVDVDFVRCNVAELEAVVKEPHDEGQDDIEHVPTDVDGGLPTPAESENVSADTAALPQAAADALSVPVHDMKNKCDTVFMNPPFGTRVKGIDMVFLRLALDMATTAVYTLHKSSTRKHVLKVGARQGAVGQVLATLKFDVPKMYAFHKEKSKDIQVDFIRFDKTTMDGPGAVLAATAAAQAVAFAFPAPAPAGRNGSGGGNRKSRGKGKQGGRNQRQGGKSGKGRGSGKKKK